MRVFKSRCSTGCIPEGMHRNKVVVSITYLYLDGLCRRLRLGKDLEVVCLGDFTGQGRSFAASLRDRFPKEI